MNNEKDDEAPAHERTHAAHSSFIVGGGVGVLDLLPTHFKTPKQTLVKESVVRV